MREKSVSGPENRARHPPSLKTRRFRPLAQRPGQTVANHVGTMMRPAASWSIEGVAPEVRESAREAARRAGLSVGEWLNAAIAETAEEAGGAGGEPRRDEESARLAQAIGRLTERLERLVEAGPALAREAAPYLPPLDAAV